MTVEEMIALGRDIVARSATAYVDEDTLKLACAVLDLLGDDPRSEWDEVRYPGDFHDEIRVECTLSLTPSGARSLAAALLWTADAAERSNVEDPTSTRSPCASCGHIHSGPGGTCIGCACSMTPPRSKP